ncbi:MAG: SDR family oxidoreductase [Thermoplasmata archaeon]
MKNKVQKEQRPKNITLKLEKLMKNKRVCITGGAGFIGSNLAEVLSKNNEVIVLDNLSTGKKENLSGLDVNFIKGDILDAKVLKKAFKDVDYVFHQAAVPSVPRSIAEPITSNMNNLDGTLNVLIAARDANVKRLVFASSSSVYGDTPTLPKIETMLPMPLSPYAVTKLASEYYCKVFWTVYGLSTVSLRYFNVYGPRQDPTSQYAAVIPKFISFAFLNKPLTIFGDGTQTRDFSYVKDVVKANILAALSDKADGEVINIASGRAITLNELAKLIIEKTGKDCKIEYLPVRKGDILHSLADLSKAKKLLGYVPDYTIEKGIEETVESMKNNPIK